VRAAALLLCPFLQSCARKAGYLVGASADLRANSRRLTTAASEVAPCQPAALWLPQIQVALPTFY